MGKRWDPCSNFICLPIKTSAGLRCWELRRSSNFCFLNSSVLSPQQCNLVYCRNCSKNKLKDEMFDITEIAWTNNFWKCQSYSKVLIIKYQMNEYFQAFSVRFALMELLSSEYLHRGKCVENNFEWILFDEKIFVFSIGPPCLHIGIQIVWRHGKIISSMIYFYLQLAPEWEAGANNSQLVSLSHFGYMPRKIPHICFHLLLHF